MYILTFDQLGTTYFWLGKGYVTRRFDLAKRYKTWEAADRACKRIKCYEFKFMSEEDYQDEIQAKTNRS